MTNFDSRQFRDVLGLVPTSVVVVTGLDESGTPQGITIGSFVSVSLDPPLVGFLPGTNSKTWNAIKTSGSFCVNVLTAVQGELCWRFAKETDDRFAGVEWKPSENGSPALGGAAVRIDCSLESDTVYGDHFFVVGRVTHLAGGEGEDSAMAFYRGKVTEVSLPT